MKKLRINDLKVKSFVTDIKGKVSETVKGGATFDGTGICQASKPVNEWCQIVSFGECPE